MYCSQILKTKHTHTYTIEDSDHKGKKKTIQMMQIYCQEQYWENLSIQNPASQENIK